MAFERFKGYLSLSDDVNKVKEDSIEEGVVSKLTPELTLTTDDKDLISLKSDWIKEWEPVQKDLNERQKESENYWLGIHPHDFIRDYGANDELKRHPLIDNLIFESLETYLPQATRRNPEPIVIAANNTEITDDGQELAERVRKMLIYLADNLNLRLKIKSVTRSWALFFLGVAKIGWNIEKNEISITPLLPQKFIMDPTATITENGEYTGSYLGEMKSEKASELVKRFPNKSEEIKKMVKDKMGTKVQYIEWWADDGKIIFWTLKDIVLDKARNPHYNYPEKRIVIDEYGEEREESFTPANHFTQPQFPYVFLSVFNLGKKPFDETSLIEQNLGNQDLITKRYRQIDDNVDGMNGGWAISGEKSGIEKEQARGAIEAFRDGRGVWIPQGNVNEAVQRMQGQGLPTDVFNQLQDARNELRGIFGVQGSTPSGIEKEQTVRGKILRGQSDQSRIGGGVTEYIEQFSDRTFNMFLQMMYVYYDEPHMGSIIGRSNAAETVVLRNSDLNRKLTVSVKEGSLIPKDPLTTANQAIDLFAAGAISPLTLHERLDDPNPQETVNSLVDFQTGQIQLDQGSEAQATSSPLQMPAGQGPTDILSEVPIQ